MKTLLGVGAVIAAVLTEAAWWLMWREPKWIRAGGRL